MSYKSLIIGAIVIIIGGAIGYHYFFMGNSPSAQPPAPPAVTPPVATTPTVSTYATSTFTITYPPDFTINPNFSNTSVVPSKPIAGVQFTIPETMATGTNLAADSYVSVEWLPRAKECTGDIYLSQNVKSTDITDNGVQYSLATSTEGAAGSFYEQYVYALVGSQPCTAVRYFIHSSDIGNYPPGTVQAFDESSLLSTFDSIRHSLQLITPGSEAPMIPASTSTTQ